MKFVSICLFALAVLMLSTPSVEARDGFFARLFRGPVSGGSSGVSVVPVESYGSSGAAVVGGGSSGYSTTVAAPVRRQLFRRQRVVPVTSSTVYESSAPKRGCVNCRR